MALPLVTVITPAMPSRIDLLTTRCIPSVKAQDYPNIRHLIIGDGYDLETLRAAEKLDCDYSFMACTGHADRRHRGAGQRNHGISCTSPDTSIIAYLDDDDAFYPDHVSTMVRLLTANHQVGWAYAAVEWHRPEGTRYTWASPPDPGNCSSILAHHRSLPAPWQDGPREDWDLIATWLDHGVPYATDSQVTADAYGHE